MRLTAKWVEQMPDFIYEVRTEIQLALHAGFAFPSAGAGVGVLLLVLRREIWDFWLKCGLDQSAQCDSGLFSEAVLRNGGIVSGICGKYRRRAEYLSFFLLWAVQSGDPDLVSVSLDRKSVV